MDRNSVGKVGVGDEDLVDRVKTTHLKFISK